QHFSMSDYGGPGIYIATPRVTPHSADVTIAYHLQNRSDVLQALTLETVIRKDVRLYCIGVYWSFKYFTQDVLFADIKSR
ncbi:hypothetical protein, partial [Tannerella forsythia]